MDFSFFLEFHFLAVQSIKGDSCGALRRNRTLNTTEKPLQILSFTMIEFLVVKLELVQQIIQ
jgi:hypothetical protein